MELILFIGIPASGKSTFYAKTFDKTHLRLNLDMLKTRRREEILFHAALASKTKVLIDNTNVTKAQRARYIRKAKEENYDIIAYYFRSSLEDSKKRNQNRGGKAKIPDLAIAAMSKKLELPEYSEGFQTLYYVALTDGGFCVEQWKENED